MKTLTFVKRLERFSFKLTRISFNLGKVMPLVLTINFLNCQMNSKDISRNFHQRETVAYS